MPCDTGWKRHSAVKKEQEKGSVKEKPLLTRRERLRRLREKATEKGKKLREKYEEYNKPVKRKPSSKTSHKSKHLYTCPRKSCDYTSYSRKKMLDHIKDTGHISYTTKIPKSKQKFLK